MQALLAKYLANPTVANAKRVAAYHARHPFAECLFIPMSLEAAILAQALRASR